ncbi:MAG: tetratricopeptide repeat protein [Bacteroidia bacterium]
MIKKIQHPSLLLIFLFWGIFNVSAQKKPELSDARKMELERLYLNGAREKLVQNFDEAIQSFKACLLIDPSNDAVYYNLADIYFQKNQMADAEEQVNKALALNKKNNWYWKLAETIYEARRDYEKAAEICIYLSKQEDEVPNLLRAAYCYEQLRNYPKAIKMLEKAERRTGINEDIILRKEQLYLAQNKLSKAIKEIERLCKAYPSNIRYRVLLAELYLVNGKTKEGLAMYEDILKADPDNGYAAFALGDYYHSIKDYEKWFSYMKTGMGSSDVDIKSKLRMMVMFMTSATFEDQLSRSLLLAEIFINAHPAEPSAYMVKGDILVEQQQFLTAHMQYEKAVELDPSVLVAWQQMMFCSTRIPDYTLLQKDCAHALEVYPTDVVFYFYHSVASMQLKQYDTAIWSAKRGIEFAGEDLQMRAQLYTNIGEANHNLENYSASDSAFESALKLDPLNATAMNNHAYYLSLRKVQLDKAEQLSKRSLELEPENASFADTYGWILYQKKDYPRAKIYIEQSLQKEPNNAEVIEHLGDVLYQMGDTEKALELWKRAAEKGEGSKFLPRKIKDGKLYE